MNESKTFHGGAPVNFFLPFEEVEPGALQQIIATASHPHVTGHVAVMPDTHQGYGVAIGTVFDTAEVVVPNAVGVDIGCGVGIAHSGIELNEAMGDTFWKDVRTELMTRVPVGFAWHDAPQQWENAQFEAFLEKYRKEQKITSKALQQLGTLGGGNHFLEYARSELTGEIMLLVHSGSRGAGHALASRHQAVAEAVNRKKAMNRDPKDLESLSLASEEGADYWSDMWTMVEYAAENRTRMLKQMAAALYKVYADHLPRVSMAPTFTMIANKSHNYAMAGSNSVLQPVVVRHRKGACSADVGVLNVIPGSMGTASYLVRGRGNDDANRSSSHGSGRVIGRKAAAREFTMEQFTDALQGTYSIATPGTIDESPMAYKDIDTVIERQQACIEVLDRLRPILTVKGGGRDEG